LDHFSVLISLILRLLCEQRSKLSEWQLQPDPPWTMWNSGTVGIPTESEGFLDDVLRVTDELLPYVG
jgi:hypothetical protein